MNFINRLTMYIMIGAVILVLIAAIGLGILFFIRRNGSGKMKEQEKDYRDQEYGDPSDMIPIDDIRDHMIIEKGRRRFVAVIRCSGSDFYKASLAEKVRIKNTYTNFIQALTEPITFRQHGEDINMIHTMKRYQTAYDQRVGETYQLTEDYKEAKALFDQIKGTGDEREEELLKYLTQTQKRLEAYHWRILHLESQMRYIEQISGPGVHNQKAQQLYVLDWEADGGILSQGLSELEIHEKAKFELDKRCRNKIHQLNSAGVPAVRCNTENLIDICRRHLKPVSGNRFTMEDIQESSYGHPFITTNDSERMDQELEQELEERFLQ